MVTFDDPRGREPVEGQTVVDTDAGMVLFVQVGGGNVPPASGPSEEGPDRDVLGQTVRPGVDQAVRPNTSQNALAFTGLSDTTLVALAAFAAGLLLIGATLFALGRWLGRHAA